MTTPSTADKIRKAFGLPNPTWRQRLSYEWSRRSRYVWEWVVCRCQGRKTRSEQVAEHLAYIEAADARAHDSDRKAKESFNKRRKEARTHV